MPATPPAPPSPLAHEIYRCLVQVLARRQTSITYAALARAVSLAVPTHQRSRVFHAALTQVTRACRAAALPCLPALVRRAGEGAPGAGYFAVAHPRARTPEAQRTAWAEEHAAVLAARGRYPARLG